MNASTKKRKEIRALVLFAKTCLELPPREEHSISAEDLKRCAHEALAAAMSLIDGRNVVPRSEKASQIIALLKADIALGEAAIRSRT